MPPIWMHDFGMQSGLADTEVEIDVVHQVFEEAFASVFRGEVENDDFNRLVLAARLPATEIVMLRAYAKYLRQIGFPLSQPFIECDAHRASVDRARADRAVQDALRSRARRRRRRRSRRAARARSKRRSAQVDNLSEDRVLRQYLALVMATTRTNFWRRDAAGRPQELRVVQVRSVEGARLAGAEADVRDLRLLAAVRRRASARRQGRARRLALVRPAARISAPRCSAWSRRRWSRTR